MTSFVIASTGSVSGFASDAARAIVADGEMLVNKVEDLASKTLGELTAIYNAATGKTVAKFSIARDKAADKVMAALTAIDLSTLTKLETEVQATAQAEALTPTSDLSTLGAKAEETIAEAKPKAPKEPSKLQKMAAAFRTTMNEDGTPKRFTIQELQDICGTTEDRTHQYISILKNPKDRFVMNIAKTSEKTYWLVPNRPAK